MAHNAALRAELASARQRATAATQQRDRLTAQLEAERSELQKMAARAEALVGAQQALPLSSQRHRTRAREFGEQAPVEEANKARHDDGSGFVASELMKQQDAYLDQLNGVVNASEQKQKQKLMRQQDAYLDELSGMVNRLGTVSLTKTEATETEVEQAEQAEVEAAPATPTVTASSGAAVTAAATLVTPPVVPLEQLMASSHAKENRIRGAAVPGKRPSSHGDLSPPPRRSGLMDRTNQLSQALGMTLPSQ